MALVVALLPIPSSAAGPAATVDQCVNGGVGATPEPCLDGTLVPTSFSNWVNGDANASKSHWREGEFIPYRSIISGLGSSSHTLTFHYDTVHGSKHAIDYIGSYDATETTSPTATPPFHRNDNNPCFDVLGSGAGSGCTSPGTPPTPASIFLVPGADLGGETTCAGASGSGTTPTQAPGNFQIFAPTASIATLTGATYPTGLQNVASGTGQCSTTMAVTFTLSGTAPPGGWTVVLAWGGHIASQLDWGTGNSATSINGSPYHMILDSIDTTGIGNQDRALSASAIFFTPTISTTVINNSTGIAVSGPLAFGTVVHDTATLTGASSSAGGTITFTLRNDTGTTQCAGTTISTEPVSISNGSANSPSFATSSNFTPGAAGSYSYQAVYGGDAQDIPGRFTSACEPFPVGQASPSA